MKIIKITNCEVCPYRANYPNLGGVKRVPFCNHHNSAINNQLPYELAKKAIKPTASATNEIPDWCPLEDC